jgi:hypothetical protein
MDVTIGGIFKVPIVVSVHVTVQIADSSIQVGTKVINYGVRSKSLTSKYLHLR